MSKMFRKILLLLIGELFVAALAWPSLAADPSAQVQRILRDRIEEGQGRLERCAEKIPCRSSDVPLFYKRRSFHPAWSREGQPGPQVQALVGELKKAHREGLDPEEYHLAALESILAEIRREKSRGKAPSAEELADLDLLLSDAFLTYAAHLQGGRVSPGRAGAKWYVREQKTELVPLLQIAVEKEQVAEKLRDLIPDAPGYIRLRDALAEYRRIKEDGGWPKVLEGENLRRKDVSKRVPALRARLAATGDLDEEKDREAISKEVKEEKKKEKERAKKKGKKSREKEKNERAERRFNEAIGEAVRKFQRRHGLEDDGVVGRRTLAVLNVPVEERISQILLNMERWRWMPRDLGERYILVNIAGFRLEAVEKDRPELKMKVIVGQRYTRTPVFTAPMSRVVFRPYWNVPTSIAVKEMIPKIRQDPRYLEKNRLRVLAGWGKKSREVDPRTINWSSRHFPYRLRQEAGPANSLGLVKFLMPNRFNVYLHDTPGQALFREPVRQFSHGCIRVEKPVELAEFVLEGDADWTTEKIQAAMEDEQDNRIVRLARPITVHIVYFTAWVGEGGTVQFREDIYDRDEPLENALQEEEEK